ncbi:MAG: dihydroorotate dehydrogenase-like protein [Streptosporangiaceae bacterium]|jgi:dihydroorotate dehydrogenase (fumarate)
MDMTTKYLGLTLRNPLIASAGPVTGTYDGIMRLAEAGAGAVVLPSLFEEQLKREEDHGSAALDYLPPMGDPLRAGQYVSLVEKASANAGIPVIASLNGTSPGGWTDYASALEQAGAAAIELNVYYLPGDPAFPARDVERRYVEVLTTVKAVVQVPVAVKTGPYLSSFGEMAVLLDQVGADGLVLFNRFMQTDVDPESFTVSTGFRLSQPSEGALSRSWISRLRGRVGCSLAGSTGVETSSDVAAYLLAGADVVMSTSALLRHGPAYVTELLDGLTDWGERKGFATVTEFRGLLSADFGHPVADREGYLTAIEQASHAYAR